MPDIVAARYLLLLRYQKLRVLRAAGKIVLKLSARSDSDCVPQIFRQRRIVRIIARPFIGSPTVPILNRTQITVFYIKLGKGGFRVLNIANLLHDLLKLTDSCDILFLLIVFILGIIDPVVSRRCRHGVAHLFDEVNHADRHAVVKHSLIVGLFPDIILFDVLLSLALVHLVEVVGV